MLIARTLTLLLALGIGGCDRTSADIRDLEGYEQSIRQWHEERIGRLTDENGYLNLAGLHWLSEGSSRFGAAADNDIVLPADKAEPYVGTLNVAEGRVLMTIEEGVLAHHGGQPVTKLWLSTDQDEQQEPSVITHRTLAWFAIEREGKIGLRVRDFEHPALTEFSGIQTFPIDPGWRTLATLRPHDEPRQMNIPTVIEGLDYAPVSPGILEFELEGRSYTVEPAASGDRLFIIFADSTTGRETYGAGRFLYTAAPDERGETIIDFNMAYNPPCAFNDFSTCPIAPPQNRLPIAINAGEKYDRSLHLGTAH